MPASPGRTGQGDKRMRSGLKRFDLFDGQLIVAANDHVRTQLAEILHEVVGEGIVVVEHENHRQTSVARSLAPTDGTDATACGVQTTGKLLGQRATAETQRWAGGKKALDREISWRDYWVVYDVSYTTDMRRLTCTSMWIRRLDTRGWQWAWFWLGGVLFTKRICARTAGRNTAVPNCGEAALGFVLWSGKCRACFPYEWLFVQFCAARRLDCSGSTADR